MKRSEILKKVEDILPCGSIYVHSCQGIHEMTALSGDVADGSFPVEGQYGVVELRLMVYLGKKGAD